MLLLLALAGEAHAGACCVGTTTTTPTRLGPCEGWIAALSVAGESSIGRWDAERQLSDNSLSERDLVGTLGAAWRWNRKGQVALTAPVRFASRAAGDTSELGGGPGDLRALVLWTPIEEGRKPAPALTLGTRLPTGTSWAEGDTALGADVTGLQGPAVFGQVALERTTGKYPWAIGVDAELGTDEPLLVGGLATGGVYLGTAWSLAGSLRHAVTVADEGLGTAYTRVGAGITRGQQRAWRAWAGGEIDAPLPGVGLARSRYASVGVGAAIVR